MKRIGTITIWGGMRPSLVASRTWGSHRLASGNPTSSCTTGDDDEQPAPSYSTTVSLNGCNKWQHDPSVVLSSLNAVSIRFYTAIWMSLHFISLILGFSAAAAAAAVVATGNGSSSNGERLGSYWSHPFLAPPLYSVQYTHTHTAVLSCITNKRALRWWSHQQE